MTPPAAAFEQTLPVTEVDQRLCSKCAAISLDYSNHTEPDFPRIYLGALNLILQRDRCALCAIIRELWVVIAPQLVKQPCPPQNITVTLQFARGIGYSEKLSLDIELSVHSRRHMNKISGDDDTIVADRGDNICYGEDIIEDLRYVPKLRITQEDWRKAKILSSEYATPHLFGRPLDNHCNLELLRTQLEKCIKTHGNVCEQSRVWPWKLPSGQIPLRMQLPADFRLIDVVSLQITKAPSNPQFVALSYRWDHKDQEHENMERHETLTKHSWRQLTAKGGVDLSRLPQTIVDAVQVCQALNLRFLWVDSLCIMQDDADELREQIHRMDAIYSLATITIVEATSSEPRQGLECLRSRSPKQK